MPYIPQERRVELDSAIDNLIDALGSDAEAGDFNYAFTKILLESYEIKEDPRYWKLNEIVGLLTCCRDELYRKFAVPYEEAKEAENGEV